MDNVIEKSYNVQPKIIWNGDLSLDVSQQFYPSFFKEISKREPFFLENFSTIFQPATVSDFENIFLPLYTSEIMARENYTLDRKEIIQSIASRIQENPKTYYFFFIYNKEKVILGATLVSIKEGRLGMAFRAYRRDISIPALKHKASLDYWGEKILKEQGKRMGLTVFSHGKDTHPYVGRKRIGLPLYKMKAGTRPKLADVKKYPVETKSVEESFFLSQQEPVVFFTDPNQDGWYTTCHLSYPKGSLHESFVNEFRKVTEWAKIEFDDVAF